MSEIRVGEAGTMGWGGEELCAVEIP